MAKGDSTSPSPSGQAQGMNPKMDQYSVMHHMMAQLGQGGQSIGPSQNFGQKFGGGGQMGGALGVSNSAPQMMNKPDQWDSGALGNMMGANAPQAGNNFSNTLGQMGLMAGSMAPQFQQQQQRLRPQFQMRPEPQSGIRQQMMGNNVA